MLLIAGIATFASLILMIAMSGGEIARPAEYPNKNGFTQAIFWFEMVRSPEEVRSVLGEPGTGIGIRLRRAMDMTNTYDYIFLVCYPLFIGSLFLFIDRLLAESGRRPRFGTALLSAGICLSAVIIAADAYENVQLLALTAYTDLSKIDPAVLTKLIISTNVKSGTITAAGIMLTFYYALYFKKSRGLLLAVLYAISTALSFIALTVPSQRALIETGASLGMIGWLVSTIHGGYWFFKNPSGH